MAKAVLHALPLFPVPGVSFTLYLYCSTVLYGATTGTEKKEKFIYIHILWRYFQQTCKKKFILSQGQASKAGKHTGLIINSPLLLPYPLSIHWFCLLFLWLLLSWRSLLLVACTEEDYQLFFIFHWPTCASLPIQLLQSPVLLFLLPAFCIFVLGSRTLKQFHPQFPLLIILKTLSWKKNLKQHRMRDGNQLYLILILFLHLLHFSFLPSDMIGLLSILLNLPCWSWTKDCIFGTAGKRL